MINPLNTLRKFQSRLGKPIRPIVELQKDCSVVNIVTNSIQTENLIQDSYRNEAWEMHPEVPASAIYIDGVFKGMGFFAGEEGHILKLTKSVELTREVKTKIKNPDGSEEEKIVEIPAVRATYKGLLSKLLDASIIERGSALKPSMTQTIIYCFMVFLVGLFWGISWQ